MLGVSTEDWHEARGSLFQLTNNLLIVALCHYMVANNWVIIISGIGLLSSGTKPYAKSV